MYNFSSSPTLTNCTFIGNSTRGQGGGMVNGGSSPMMVNCTFIGNSASQGAGMSNFTDSSPAVTNCTFTANSADSAGGGMYNSNNSSPRLTNCILWGNSDFGGIDGSAQIHTASGNPVVNYSIIQGGWSGAGGVGVIHAVPLFVDADGPDDIAGTADDDLRLSFGSPGIDAGDNDAVPAGTSTDLGGNPRFVDQPFTPDTGNGIPPVVDMGAYEFQFQWLPCTVDADCDDGVDCTTDTCDASLRCQFTPDNGKCDEGEVCYAEQGCGQPVPTVSEWGLLVMTLILLTAGTVLIRFAFPASVASGK